MAIKVVYTSKDLKSRKISTALDWLARLVTHIPGRYEQTVRYYGWYSNKSRGIRMKADRDDTIPAVILNEMSSKEWRQSWARLIQKIYEVAPLTLFFSFRGRFLSNRPFRLEPYFRLHHFFQSSFILFLTKRKSLT